MRRLHRATATLATSAFLVALANVVGAQGLKTAQEILDFSASKMRGYKTWSADYTSPLSGQMVQKPPGRIWMQLDMPATMGQPVKMTMVMGQDGIIWRVMQMGDRYRIVKMDMNKIANNPLAPTGLFVSALDQFDPTKQWETTEAVCDFTAAEGAELEGQPMYVLEGTWKRGALTNQLVAMVASMVGKVRMFIGQNDGFVHRMEHWDKSKLNIIVVFEFKNLKFNQDIPDSAFVYHPPADAEVMDMTSMFETHTGAAPEANAPSSEPTPAPTVPAPGAK